MPDIAMCTGTNCPLRSNCYRHLATPSEFRQSWGGFSYNTVSKSCSHFWDYKQYKDGKQKTKRN